MKKHHLGSFISPFPSSLSKSKSIVLFLFNCGECSPQILGEVNQFDEHIRLGAYILLNYIVPFVKTD